MKPELLSPAGDMERLRAAVMYGADAVYLAGKSFGMRSGADNFSLDEIAEAITFAHANGVRVYVACNIVAHEKEITQLPAFLSFLKDAGADALIISDLGVFSLAKKYASGVPVHISTQTGVANSAAANALYEMGAARVVLARELTLEEIAEIRKSIPPELELEAFVHGSMCVSFSGRCLLSNYLTGRDANRGDCAQPCRWSYSLMEEKRPGEYFPVFETAEGTHILNSKDLCMIDYLPLLKKAGISSFKIEGRAKAAYYVVVTSNAYRMAIDYFDGCGWEEVPLKKEISDEVYSVSHRVYSTGFYFGTEPGQNYENGGYERPYEVAAVVTGNGNGFLLLSQRNRFFEGDELELVSPGKLPVVITVSELYDGEGERITSAPHPTMELKIPFEGYAPAGSILRKKKK